MTTAIVALTVFLVSIVVGLGILAFTRRMALKFNFFRASESVHVNEAITGTVGAVGVLFGITVGLIAIDVWQRHARAEDIVLREAAAMTSLYDTVRALFGPVGNGGQAHTGNNIAALELYMRKYVYYMVCTAWPAAEAAKAKTADRQVESLDAYFLRAVGTELARHEPKYEGEKIWYAAAIRLFDEWSETKVMRLDAAHQEISTTMWCIIIAGSLMSIFVVGLFDLDVKLHRALVVSLSGLLALLILVIVLNDKPFLGVSALDYRAAYDDLSLRIFTNYPSRDCMKLGEEAEWFGK